MSDYLVSVLRTAVPALWGSAVAWLAGVNLLPADLIEQAEGFAVVLVALAVALYYAAVRAAEPHLPGWLAAVLIGSGKGGPQYQAAGASPGRASAPETYPAD